MSRIASLLVVVLLLSGCRKGARADRTADTAAIASGMAASGPSIGPLPDSAGVAATTDSAMADSMFVLASDSATGEVLFAGKGRCVACHGSRGVGVRELGPPLTDSLAAALSPYTIDGIVRQGVTAPRRGAKPMPSFGGSLGPGESARLAVYVFALSHPGRTVSDTLADSTKRPIYVAKDSLTP